MVNRKQADLNRKKTEYMIIGSRQKLNSIGTNTTNISIAGEQIKRVESTKSLGIIIDEQLKWEEHNSKQCKTISALPPPQAIQPVMSMPVRRFEFEI